MPLTLYLFCRKFVGCRQCEVESLTVQEVCVCKPDSLVSVLQQELNLQHPD
jgi:hypothetical protein